MKGQFFSFITTSRITPTIQNPYDSMGDYFLATEQSDKAAKMFNKAIEINGNPHSTTNLKD